MLNSGDTGFMMIATALVFFMTPGLAFFYGGLVRRKNVLNTMISSFFIMGLAAAMWVFFGYSLSFSGDFGGIIGSLKQVSLSGLGAEPGAYADTIPATLFVAFQMMFAIITPALITGAVAGRMKFKALFLFIIFCFPVFLLSLFGFNGENIVYVIFYMIYLRIIGLFSFQRFMKQVLFPLLLISILSLPFTYLVYQFPGRSFCHLILTCLTSVIITCTCIFFIGLNKLERQQVISKIRGYAK